MSKTFVVPVYWEMYSTVSVAANTYEEAVKILENRIDDIPLGHAEYVDESYQIDYEAGEEVNRKNVGDVFLCSNGDIVSTDENGNTYVFRNKESGG